MSLPLPLGCWQSSTLCGASIFSMPTKRHHQIRALRVLAARYGLVLRPVNLHDWTGLQYDGDNRTLRACVSADDEEIISNLAHELAHWLRSSQERRHEPEFGLGLGPESVGKAFRATADNPMDEEIHASMLGILIEREIGADYTWTWDYHEWRDAQPGAVRQCLAELRELGLVIWTGQRYVPTCV